MKIWIFLLLICGLAMDKAFGATIAIVDGRPVFLGYCSTCALTAPQDFEVNLSTTIVVIIDDKIEIGFDNYSDWLSCQTRSGLRRKYRKIQATIDSFGALPASLAADLRERAGWLRSYYLSLP